MTDFTEPRLDHPPRPLAQRVGAVLWPSFFAAGVSTMWFFAFNTPDGTLTRIGLADDTVQATLPTGDGAAGVAVAEGAVWVANTGADDVSRVEPASG